MRRCSRWTARKSINSSTQFLMSTVMFVQYANKVSDAPNIQPTPACFPYFFPALDGVAFASAALPPDAAFFLAASSACCALSKSMKESLPAACFPYIIVRHALQCPSSARLVPLKTPQHTCSASHPRPNLALNDANFPASSSSMFSSF
jgi:hypothetical protein